jgi:hypothetical protein
MVAIKFQHAIVIAEVHDPPVVLHDGPVLRRCLILFQQIIPDIGYTFILYLG